MVEGVEADEFVARLSPGKPMFCGWYVCIQSHRCMFKYKADKISGWNAKGLDAEHTAAMGDIDLPPHIYAIFTFWRNF